jgi:hypothetical protein
MSELVKTPNSGAAVAERSRYFKMQIRGWTDFDPMDKSLPEITQAIERGGGFLTAVEVLEVKDDLSAITDNLVKEGFQNILAARRVLHSIGELPTALVEDLRAALNTREEAGKKPAAPEDSQSLRIKRAS